MWRVGYSGIPKRASPSRQNRLDLLYLSLLLPSTCLEVCMQKVRPKPLSSNILSCATMCRDFCRPCSHVSGHHRYLGGALQPAVGGLQDVHICTEWGGKSKAVQGCPGAITPSRSSVMDLIFPYDTSSVERVCCPWHAFFLLQRQTWCRYEDATFRVRWVAGMSHTYDDLVKSFSFYCAIDHTP